MLEQSYQYPQEVPEEQPSRYVGLRPISFLTPRKTPEQYRQEMLDRLLTTHWLQQRRLPPVAPSKEKHMPKVSALQEYLQKTAKLLIPDKDEPCDYESLKGHLHKTKMDNMEKELEQGWLRSVNRLKKSDTPTV